MVTPMTATTASGSHQTPSSLTEALRAMENERPGARSRDLRHALGRSVSRREFARAWRALHTVGADGDPSTL